jgi:adenosylcobyric acid synthase
VDIDAEDSLGIPGQDPASEGVSDQKLLEVCVIRLPRMSNFTDFDPLQLEPGVNVRFVSRGEQLSDADLIVLPGSKSTVEDLDWLRTNGISETLLKLLGQPDGPLLLGVCGGYQILGVRIVDGIESNSPEVDGLGLLPVETVFHPEKTTRRRSGSALGMVSPELIGADISGYEIRHGDPQPVAGAVAASDGAAGPWISLSDRYGTVDEGWAEPEAGVFGTSLHGLFENDGVRMAILTMAAARRGKRFDDSGMRFGALRQRRLDRLADAVEGALDMEGLKSVISSARSADGGGR